MKIIPRVKVLTGRRWDMFTRRSWGGRGRGGTKAPPLPSSPYHPPHSPPLTSLPSMLSLPLPPATSLTAAKAPTSPNWENLSAVKTNNPGNRQIAPTTQIPRDMFAQQLLKQGNSQMKHHHGSEVSQCTWTSRFKGVLILWLACMPIYNALRSKKQEAKKNEVNCIKQNLGYMSWKRNINFA